MEKTSLIQIAVFLMAAAIAAPLAKRAKVGAVIGYLAAGIIIGPYGVGLIYSVYEVESVLHIAEFGVVLLLFLIGLELRPQRLWAMRNVIFGLGGLQMLLTSAALAGIGLLLNFSLMQAVFLGLILSLSSTAFTLHVLEEKGELAARHGRLAFGILLFQDLAAIPMLAMVPLFAVSAATQSSGLEVWSVLRGIGVIVGVILIGRFVINHLYRAVAATGVREAMTASALLTVVGVAILMEVAGLSAALGAFIAGALLADSQYRHQIEADIAPFEGLLLGLFFTAVGMSLNLKLIVEQPLMVLALLGGLVGIKTLVLFLLGRYWGLPSWSARRMGLAVAPAGEFAFVLLGAGAVAGVLAKDLAGLLTLTVTLSMLLIPLLLLLDELFAKPEKEEASPVYDAMPEEQGHVIIAGLGRFGQVVARVLQAEHIPFTALDRSPEHVAVVRKYGGEIYYGDASRLDLLRAARADKARSLVVAIDDVEQSLKTVEIVRKHFPDLKIHARARNRQHAHRLMDLGIDSIRRETFLSALDLTKEVLERFGKTEEQIERDIEAFKNFDQNLLYEDYKHYDDEAKLQTRARSASKELDALFQKGLEERKPQIQIARVRKNALPAPPEPSEHSPSVDASYDDGEDAPKNEPDNQGK